MLALHLQATLACGPAEAFRLFTTGPGLERWLAPRAEVEAKVGGRYELHWNPADPSDNHTRGCTITALAPDELVAFDWRGPSALAAGMNNDPLTHVVVSFVPLAAGTRVHLVHSGWPSSAEGQAARAWFEQAWTMAFAALVQLHPAGD